jgi:hypothetical protein
MLGTKLKRNYMWGYANKKKGLNTAMLDRILNVLLTLQFKCHHEAEARTDRQTNGRLQ